MIAWLASDEVQEGDHSSFGSGWVTGRRAFTGEKVESVIDSSGETKAYCSLERASGEQAWRAFIVLDWSNDDLAVREAAFAELERLATSVGAPTVWMRELEDDRTLLAFVQSKGFTVVRRYEFEGAAMANLEKFYDGDPSGPGAVTEVPLHQA
jgi:hypothetical protein